MKVVISPRAQKLLKTTLTVAVVCAASSMAVETLALAGTDTTFAAPTTTLTNWATGSLGKLVSVASIAGALLGIALRFDWRLIGGSAAVGLTSAAGPGIVAGLATATF